MKVTNILLGALMVTMSPATVAAQAIEGAPDGYSLIWSDEFDGTALNERNWDIEVSGSGGGNNELQYYRRENVAVTDGNLVITARRENYQGKAFTSGRIKALFATANSSTRPKRGLCLTCWSGCILGSSKAKYRLKWRKLRRWKKRR